jgi:hypothetical protein
MAGYSARQSTFTTGDTILAAHSNDEFNQLLASFNATTGHTHDGTAGEGGPVTSIRDANTLNRVLVDSSNNHLEFYVNVSSSSVQQLRIQDGAIVPITDNDIDLGTSSLEFKDAFFDGTVEADAITIGGTNVTSLFASLSGANTFTGNIEIDVASGDPAIILDTQGADKFHFAVDDSDSDNLVIKSGGTVGSGSGLKLTSAGNLTVDGDATITGDLTVSGDDIFMATNTAGNLLIADGTNFNSVAVGDLSEISSVAADDVLLAVDTSGGGLKKIARSTLVSGLATSSAISNVADDTTPQLGGDLDVNGNDIVSVSNGNINLLPNGTGKVIIDGNGTSGGVTVTDGNIDIRTGTGAVSKVKFYCESSNAHAQTLQAQPHSAGSSADITLPVATGTLVGTGDTGSVSNDMLAGSIAASKLAGSIPDSKLSTISTAGKVDLAALEIDGGTDIGADLTTSDLIIVDDGAGGTNRKAALSRLITLVDANAGFATKGFATAMAIAL